MPNFRTINLNSYPLTRNLQQQSDDINYNFSLVTSSGGSGTPGGSNTQIQYNNAGSFGGISIATFNGSTVTITSLAASGSLSGTSSWASNALTASYFSGSISNVVSSSYASSSTSASYVLSASYALNSTSASYASSSTSASYVLQAVSASYILNAVSASYASSSTSASYASSSTSASYALFALNNYTGSTAKLSQSVANVTWSFTHNLNERYPIVNVYDSAGRSVIPGRIDTIDSSSLKIYFSVSQSGVAVAAVGGVAFTAVTASYALTTAGGGGGGGNQISTGSILATVNVNSQSFSIVSGSSTFLYVSSSGGTNISGSLSIGNITPNATLGRIDASNDIVAFSTSDVRYKTNISSIDNALEKTLSLKGIQFEWIPNTEVHGNVGEDIGVIAQEVEKILPQAVTTRDNGVKAVRYEKLIPLLIEAVKQQNVIVKELKDELEKIKQQLK